MDTTYVCIAWDDSFEYIDVNAWFLNQTELEALANREFLRRNGVALRANGKIYRGRTGSYADNFLVFPLSETMPVGVVGLELLDFASKELVDKLADLEKEEQKKKRVATQKAKKAKDEKDRKLYETLKKKFEGK